MTELLSVAAVFLASALVYGSGRHDGDEAGDGAFDHTAGIDLGVRPQG